MEKSERDLSDLKHRVTLADIEINILEKSERDLSDLKLRVTLADIETIL